MSRKLFDRLHTVRLEHESKIGCSALCQASDGTKWVRLSLSDPSCQREFLDALQTQAPVRFEDGVLEVLLPWREGLSLDRWLWEKTPALGERRDACLALLVQLLEVREGLPPAFIGLSAQRKNLTVGDLGISLQYLPELCRWEPGLTQKYAVCRTASVIWEVLDPGPRGHMPEELQLLYRRQKEGGYTSWEQLQKDLAAIPDELPQMGPGWHSYAGQTKKWLYRYGKYILSVLAAVLLAAALFVSAAAFLHGRNAPEPVWPGMPQVGDQDLRREEGGG